MDSVPALWMIFALRYAIVAVACVASLVMGGLLYPAPLGAAILAQSPLVYAAAFAAVGSRTFREGLFGFACMVMVAGCVEYSQHAAWFDVSRLPQASYLISVGVTLALVLCLVAVGTGRYTGRFANARPA